jgi:hypothetical protein
VVWTGNIQQFREVSVKYRICQALLYLFAVVKRSLVLFSYLISKLVLITVTLVEARAVLEARGLLPEIWYMSQETKYSFSAIKYVVFVSHHKAIFKIQTKVDDLDGLFQGEKPAPGTLSPTNDLQGPSEVS